MRSRRVWLVAVLCSVPFAALEAQTGSVTASVEIAGPPVTGNGIAGLQFGRMTSGEPVDVAPTLPHSMAADEYGLQAALWRVENHWKQDAFRIELALPAVLTSGSAEIPIKWDNPGYLRVCARHSNFPNDPCYEPPAVTPQDGTVHAFDVKGSKGQRVDIDVVLGARATASAVPAGTYTAEITLTVHSAN